MNIISHRMGWVVVALCFLAVGVACGEDELDGENQPDSETNQDPENQNQDPDDDDDDDDEECEDGMAYNPVLGECIESDEPVDPNQDSACDDVDCDDGLYCEPSSGDCVECIGDGHCDEGQICTDDHECIDDPDASQDCEDDDDCDEGELCGDAGVCEDDGEEFECGPGAIIGETCTATDGVLPGADVIVEGYDCDGMSFEIDTVADNDGAYEFDDIPAGNHELTISSGSFEVTDNVSVQYGEVTDLKSVGTKLCFVGTEVDIAVASGSYDDIGSILDNMNIEYDPIVTNSSFFSDLDQMREYDIIFAECGTDNMGLGGGGFGSDGDEIAYNIRRYIEEGSSLYASDWASRFVRDTIPEAIEFTDSTGDSKEVTADVESELMQMVLESDTAEVNFNLGGWHMMVEAGPSTEVQFQGEAGGSERPFMAIYDDPIGGGRAIYTSFHNNNQATGDMEDILEFMIFQL